MPSQTAPGRIEEPARAAAPATASEDDVHREIEHIRRRRESAPTLREMAEWCVAYEEAIGGRPPARQANRLSSHASAHAHFARDRPEDLEHRGGSQAARGHR